MINRVVGLPLAVSSKPPRRGAGFKTTQTSGGVQSVDAEKNPRKRCCSSRRPSEKLWFQSFSVRVKVERAEVTVMAGGVVFIVGGGVMIDIGALFSGPPPCAPWHAVVDVFVAQVKAMDAMPGNPRPPKGHPERAILAGFKSFLRMDLAIDALRHVWQANERDINEGFAQLEANDLSTNYLTTEADKTYRDVHELVEYLALVGAGVSIGGNAIFQRYRRGAELRALEEEFKPSMDLIRAKMIVQHARVYPKVVSDQQGTDTTELSRR